MGKMFEGVKLSANPAYKPKGGPPGFTAMRNPETRAGNRPKNRKYPSKARTPLGG